MKDNKYSDCCETPLLEQETIMCSSCKEHCDVIRRYLVDISSVEVFAKDSDSAWDKVSEMYQDGTTLLDEVELTGVHEW